MDVKQIRKANILKLYELHGGPSGLARKVGTSESYLSQITSDKGNRNIGDKLARNIEMALNLPRGWMDMMAFDATVTSSQSPQKTYIGVAETATHYDHEAKPIDMLFAKVQRYDVGLSAGHGANVVDESGNGYLYFRRDWLAKKRLNENDLCVVYVTGHSMEPTLCDSEVILVDSAGRHIHRETIENGGIYAINIDGDAMVKRLFKKPGGGVIARSDSPAPQYQDIVLEGADLEYFRIIGRAVWHAGDL